MIKKGDMVGFKFKDDYHLAIVIEMRQRSPYYPQNHRWMDGRDKKSYRNYLTKRNRRVRLLKQTME